MARRRADPVAPTAVTIMWSNCSANGLPSSPAAVTPHKRQLHINAIMCSTTLLHADQGHPHVHMVVKAVSEQGSRLYIRRHTLREWRRDFARYLRDLGVEANATERAVRGASRTTKRDGIHRAMLRGESTHMRARAEAVARELATGGLRSDPGQRVLLETRKTVLDGWRGLADLIERDGNPQLGVAVRRFAEAMPPPRTEKETIARQIEAHFREHRVREQPRTR